MSNITPYESHDDLMKRESMLPAPQSMNDLVALDSRQFIFVTRTFGKEKIVKTINEALLEICRYMNFEISADMTTKAAELISEEYPVCKIADLKMFERFMMKGGAGKLFRLDVPTLLEAFAKYYAERAEVFAAHRENEHLKRKKSIDDGDLPSNERMKELLEIAKLKAIEKYEGEKEYQAIKWLSPQEIVERNGHKYAEVITRHQESWKETWDKSGIRDEMPLTDYYRYRQTILDLQIKAGKEY